MSEFFEVYHRRAERPFATSLARLIRRTDGLSQLHEVARKLGGPLLLRGGTLRRAALLLNEGFREVDLFDLTPFASDVDIVHSGPPEDTPRVLDSIYEQFPHAEWFRWEVLDARTFMRFERARAHQPLMPATTFTYSTTGHVYDPWNGLRDIRRSEYRFIDNTSMRRGTLYRQGRALELFPALSYLQLTLEHRRFGAGEVPLFGDTCEELLTRVAEDDQLARRLQSSGYLHARLHYLLKNVCAMSTESEREELMQTQLHSILATLDDQTQTRSDPIGFTTYLQPSNPRLVVASHHLEGHAFRLPHMIDGWDVTGGERLLGLVTAHGRSTLSSEGLSRTLDSVVAMSPEFPVHPGPAPSSRLTKRIHNEIVALAGELPMATAGGLEGQELSLAIALTNLRIRTSPDTPRSLTFILPLPGITRLHVGRDLARVESRISLGALLEGVAALHTGRKNPTASLLLVRETDFPATTRAPQMMEEANA